MVRTEEQPVLTLGSCLNMSDERLSGDSSDFQSDGTSSFRRLYNTRKLRKKSFLLLLMFPNRKAAILGFGENLFKTFEVLNFNVNVQVFP